MYQSPVPVIAKPILEELARKYQDTVDLAVEDEAQVLYVDKVPRYSRRAWRWGVGQRMPLSRTGIGKTLLLDTPQRWESTFDSESPVEQASHQTKEAFLSRMKAYAKEGIALDREDNETGLRCVVAPIRNDSGQIIAAISMSATNTYMPDERMMVLKSVMGSTATQISRKLGYSGKTF
ncbi:IclR family transcriptional regulator [Glutamicibacter sp. AGC84]